MWSLGVGEKGWAEEGAASSLTAISFCKSTANSIVFGGQTYGWFSFENFYQILAWRIPGTGEPGGLPSLGSHKVRHDWSDLAAAAAADYLTEKSQSWVLWLIALKRHHDHWSDVPENVCWELWARSCAKCFLQILSLHLPNSPLRLWLLHGTNEKIKASGGGVNCPRS